MQPFMKVSPFRHWVMKRFLFTTNLLELTFLDVKGFQDNLYTGAINTNFSKTLDSIINSLLALKKKFLAFSPVSWIAIYLAERTQSPP